MKIWTMALLQLFCLSGPVNASIIAHDSIGTRSEFVSGPSATFVGHYDPTIINETAMSFVNGAGGYLESILIDAYLISGENSIYVNILQDNQGAPGSVLTSIDVLDKLTLTGTAYVPYDPVLVTFGSDLLLTEGERYWVSLGTENIYTAAAWYLGIPTESKDMAFRNILVTEDWFTFQTNEPRGFTVFVAPVPVPAAVWLFGSGVLGLIGFAKLKVGH